MSRPTAAAKVSARPLSAAASLRVAGDFRAVGIVGVVTLATHKVQIHALYCMHYSACRQPASIRAISAEIGGPEFLELGEGGGRQRPLLDREQSVIEIE